MLRERPGIHAPGVARSGQTVLRACKSRRRSSPAGCSVGHFVCLRQRRNKSVAGRMRMNGSLEIVRSVKTPELPETRPCSIADERWDGKGPVADALTEQ